MITGRSRSSDRWLRSSPGPAVPARRLVCLPHAGGTAQAYRTWQDGVPDDTGVYAVQYPGRQDRLREPPATSIEQLAGPIADALDPLTGSPMVLFGHSLGAIVAYEVTLELERRHGPVIDLLIVSGSRAPHERETDDKHLLSDRELAAEIERVDESFGELAQDPELLGLLVVTHEIRGRLLPPDLADLAQGIRQTVARELLPLRWREDSTKFGRGCRHTADIGTTPGE
ncbi:thioesterase II family protein [Micromonospora rubida]|uniref:thioesterase II family protein n=1 Tax=Micromonospora rubida TaxID=2697657 RepID=UPI001377A288|nr:alpha/beta fold hydrolase [Micromonospora rubida]NBE84782.1 alpha/beta fold hydrolase [Micromonospora rubida]